jgi:hypothetical protein
MTKGLMAAADHPAVTTAFQSGPNGTSRAGGRAATTVAAQHRIIKVSRKPSIDAARAEKKNSGNPPGGTHPTLLPAAVRFSARGTIRVDKRP